MPGADEEDAREAHARLRTVAVPAILVAISAALFLLCAFGYRIAKDDFGDDGAGLSRGAIDFLSFAYSFGAISLLALVLFSPSYPRFAGWTLVGAGLPLLPLAGMEFAAEDLSALETAIGVASAVAFVLPPVAGALLLLAVRRGTFARG
ncbi:MAG: hypothetical protein IT302_08225 [Dehalococcoidia bacterium]|nr:hypothetical protein [Dehalococcoidia bacterium]